MLLDGRNMLTRAAAHDELAAKLSLPAYYGRNLDALWDLISTMRAEVTLTHASALRAALGDYAERLLDTLREAAEENPGFTFRVLEEEENADDPDAAPDLSSPLAADEEGEAPAQTGEDF